MANPRAKTRRNEEILYLHFYGESYASLALRHDLSKVRIKQIVAREIARPPRLATSKVNWSPQKGGRKSA